VEYLLRPTWPHHLDWSGGSVRDLDRLPTAKFWTTRRFSLSFASFTSRRVLP